MITRINKVIEPDEAREILRYVHDNNVTVHALGTDRLTYWIYRTDHFARDLFDRFTDLVQAFAPMHGINCRLEANEIQIGRYTPPGSYSGLHQDTVPSTPRSHLRKLSLSIELLGDYDGNGIDFRDVPGYQFDTGDAILFDSYEWHAPAKVHRGERVSLIMWFYDADSNYKEYPTSWPAGIPRRKSGRTPIDLDAAFASIGKEKPKNLHI